MRNALGSNFCLGVLAAALCCGCGVRQSGDATTRDGAAVMSAFKESLAAMRQGKPGLVPVGLLPAEGVEGTAAAAARLTHLGGCG